MSRCLVIINPVSGGGAARRYALDLQWKLSTLFDTIEVKFTTGADDATRFAKAACEDGFDAVFCMGGDGTVNETVNGIAQGGFKATFGFIPVGTVNDMSRALGIPQRPLEAIRRLDINQVRCILLALAFGGTFVETVVTGLANVQWLANGLKLAGQMLPGLGFAILLRYLPVRRNLHYLALGFGLTAMLTVLYSNVQSLGAAVSSIVGSDVFAKLPKEQAITFVNNFKSVSMIGIAIIGIFLAVQHFKNSQRTVVAAPASNVESGEIEDDEF